MKRACSISTNKNESEICEFHLAFKNKLYSDEIAMTCSTQTEMNISFHGYSIRQLKNQIIYV